MIDTTELIKSANEIDLHDLKESNLNKIFSINTNLADVAMMADHTIDIREYAGTTDVLRGLIQEYKLADEELKKRAGNRRGQIQQVRK